MSVAEQWEVMDDGDSGGGEWEVIDDQPPLRVPTGAAVAAAPASPSVALSPGSLPSVSAAKAVEKAAARAGSTSGGVAGERRVNPEDGREYTFEAIRAAYGQDFTETELTSYWRDEMRPLGGDQSRAADLLRSMGMGIDGLGASEGAGVGGFAGGLPGGMNADLGGGFNPTPIPNMTDKAGSMAGSGKPGPAPRPAERWRTLPVDTHERRLDPDDGLPRSFEELSAKFWKLCGEDWDRYIEDDVRKHWFDKCKPDPNERRRVPDEDGGSDARTYTIGELKVAFPDYSADDVASYWRDACFPILLVDQAPS